MKILIAVLILLSILCVLPSCRKSHSQRPVKSTRIIVIDDLTDSFLLRPLPNPILALYELKKNKDQEASLDYVLITDKLLDPVKHIHLDNEETSQENNTNDDVHFRDKLIKGFYQTTRSVFAQFPERFSNREAMDRSQCYCTVISQLRKLASSSYQQKILIVFSDLMENTNVFNAYSPENRKLLQEDPEKVASILSEHCDVPDNLKGIRVIFVFQPKNREEDERYLDMAAVYQMILEKRGAQASFQAGNDNFKNN